MRVLVLGTSGIGKHDRIENVADVACREEGYGVSRRMRQITSSIFSTSIKLYGKTGVDYPDTRPGSIMLPVTKKK